MTLESILLPSNADNNSLISTTEEKVRKDLRDEQTNVDFKMVTFSLSEKDYAIDITNVKEIVRASNFTFVPNVLPFVVGVYNLRGDIIPIIDMKLFFNMGNAGLTSDKGDKKDEQNDEALDAKSDGNKQDGVQHTAKKAIKNKALKSLVIITLEDQTFGIIVDNIDKVVGVQKSTIRPPHPLFSDVNIKYISGVVESNKRLYILLDIERIFSKNSSDNALHAKDKPAVSQTKAVVDTPVSQHEGNAREASTSGGANEKAASGDDESHPAAEASVPPPQVVAPPPAPVAQPKKSAKDLQASLEAKVLGAKKVAEQKAQAVTEEKPKEPPAVKVSAPAIAPKEVQPPAPASSEEVIDPTTDSDWQPLLDSLKKFATFNVSNVNDAWVKFRFNEWKKAHGSVKLTNAKDAATFLQSFWSPCSNTWWTKEYADAVFAVLPDISATQVVAWNPGCGGGPESFCLTCVLTKRYPSSKIRVYAQDKDLLAVSNAPMIDVPDALSSGWLAEYLSKTAKGKTTFTKAIKDSIMFEYHDCLNTNMLPMCDIVFGRDIVSLIDNEQQETVLNDFNEKLKNNGVLFIGENEDLQDMSQFIESTVGEITIYNKQ